MKNLRGSNKTLAAIVLAGASVFGCGHEESRSEGVKLENVSPTKEDTIGIPTYDSNKIPAGYCARYARIAAEDLFGKHYQGANAWDMRYNEKIVAEVNGNEELRELDRIGVLKPGMVVGVYYPKSRHNGENDIRGKPLRYTHVVLFLGDENGSPSFAHLFGSKTEKISIENFKKYGLRAVEVLDSRK